LLYDLQDLFYFLNSGIDVFGKSEIIYDIINRSSDITVSVDISYQEFSDLDLMIGKIKSS
jgi:hypothetical protein